MNKDEAYMALAIEEAKKAAALNEIPVGAIIVLEDRVIARGYNKRETAKDATLHAEIVAIQEACKVLKRWRLAGATMYVTLEPCPMCAGAIVMSRIARVVYGAVDSKAGACESLFNIVNNKNLNHQVNITAGVCEEECKNILQKFFMSKRQEV